jgi:hypothetical protein
MRIYVLFVLVSLLLRPLSSSPFYLVFLLFFSPEVSKLLLLLVAVRSGRLLSESTLVRKRDSKRSYQYDFFKLDVFANG